MMVRNIIGGVVLLVLIGVAAVVFSTKFGKKDDIATTTGGDPPQGNTAPPRNIGDRSKPNGVTATPTTLPKGTKPGVPTGWVEFKAEKDGFVAYFPGRVVKGGGDNLTEYGFQDYSQKIGASVDVVDTAKIPDLPSKNVAEFLAENSILANRMNELSHKEVKRSGVTGTEYLIQPQPQKEPNARHVLRVFQKDKKVYFCRVSSDTGMPSEEWVRVFFDNFEFLK